MAQIPIRNPYSLADGTTATTQATTESSTKVATTAFVKAVVPLNTKGDLLVFNGTTFVRVPVGSNKQILVADSNDANGIKWITPVVRATATGTITTTSTTPVLITGMSLTPGIGDYTAEFNADFWNNSNSRTMVAGLYVNGVLITSRSFINASPSARTTVSIRWPISVTNAAHVVEIRWSTSAGTLSTADRILELRREI